MFIPEASRQIIRLEACQVLSIWAQDSQLFDFCRSKMSIMALRLSFLLADLQLPPFLSLERLLDLI